LLAWLCVTYCWRGAWCRQGGCDGLCAPNADAGTRRRCHELSGRFAYLPLRTLRPLSSSSLWHLFSATRYRFLPGSGAPAALLAGNALSAITFLAPAAGGGDGGFCRVWVWLARYAGAQLKTTLSSARRHSLLSLPILCPPFIDGMGCSCLPFLPACALCTCWLPCILLPFGTHVFSNLSLYCKYVLPAVLSFIHATAWRTTGGAAAWFCWRSGAGCVNVSGMACLFMNAVQARSRTRRTCDGNIAAACAARRYRAAAATHIWRYRKRGENGSGVNAAASLCHRAPLCYPLKDVRCLLFRSLPGWAYFSAKTGALHAPYSCPSARRSRRCRGAAQRGGDGAAYGRKGEPIAPYKHATLTSATLAVTWLPDAWHAAGRDAGQGGATFSPRDGVPGRCAAVLLPYYPAPLHFCISRAQLNARASALSSPPLQTLSRRKQRV